MNTPLTPTQFSDCDMTPSNPENPSYYEHEVSAGVTPEQNKIRKICIEEVHRGFIVNVGCHTFAISTKTELINNLIEYISEPHKTEEKWFAGNLFDN